MPDEPAEPAIVQSGREEHDKKPLLLAFVCILLAGLPLWHSTTSTERRSMPSTFVHAWSQQLPCPIELKTRLTFERSFRDALIWNHTAFGDPSRLSGDCLAYELGADGVDSLSLALDPSLDRPSYRDGTLSVPALTLSSLAPITKLVSSLADSRAPEPSKVVKYAPKYKLVFSLFYQNASAEASLPKVDLRPFLASHIYPTLSMLKGMHNFSIETQTQYHAPLAIDTHKAPDGGIVKADQLKAFINAAEWNLAATGSRDPTLHFIAYLPTPDLRPLRSIHDNGLFSNEVAFTVPQFGSVYVLNPPAEASPQDALPQAFAVFRDQLELLLGLPRPPTQLDMGADDRVAWQRRMLMQRQVVGNAREAVETLQAIIKLTREQGNLRINGEVQGFVLRSLAALHRCKQERHLPILLRHAVEASHYASKAFFHPSMLGLLYFPQEHKYAVYTPLFGPIAIPLLATSAREFFKWRKGRRRTKTE